MVQAFTGGAEPDILHTAPMPRRTRCAGPWTSTSHPREIEVAAMVLSTWGSISPWMRYRTTGLQAAASTMSLQAALVPQDLPATAPEQASNCAPPMFRLEAAVPGPVATTLEMADFRPMPRCVRRGSARRRPRRSTNCAPLSKLSTAAASKAPRRNWFSPTAIRRAASWRSGKRAPTRTAEACLSWAGRVNCLTGCSRASGLDRTAVYIANVVPWRPPGNRT